MNQRYCCDGTILLRHFAQALFLIYYAAFDGVCRVVLSVALSTICVLGTVPVLLITMCTIGKRYI